MAKYCGYLVAEDWLLQRGIEFGCEAPKTQRDALDIMLEASRHVRLQTGVYFDTKLRRVKTRKGRYFWCIAFASDDPYQGLPTSRPPEEKYKALKELLQVEKPPLWYCAS